jgi:2-polyprenyl-3-methyl-5-hydroxy-6-metoxy-1,4-benzoquinol methylase
VTERKTTLVIIVFHATEKKKLISFFSSTYYIHHSWFYSPATMAEKHTHQHHAHHHDHAKANAEHFTERAEGYRTELSLELAKRCAGVIVKKYPFDSNQTEVLDFACGPGLVAYELLPHVKRVVGADSAQGMVDVFNRSVSV